MQSFLNSQEVIRRLNDKKWNFSSLHELQIASNETLRHAMINERSKQWSKVVEMYKKLLWMIDLRHFPNDYEPPHSYSMLQYELRYHLGVALQHLKNHKGAIAQYTKAIDVISLPKGGCQAHCVRNSCLMTPIYCRRAFAYCQMRDFSRAIKDAEKAVVLDSTNSDVFCVRSLVRNSRDEQVLALKDLDKALQFNPNHLCAIMLRDAMTRPLADLLKTNASDTVTSFNHPKIMSFFDRYFFALSVPHTILDINLKPDKPTAKQIERYPELYYRSLSVQKTLSQSSSTSFKCGTTSPTSNKTATRRRLDYGEAIRKHASKNKTPTDYTVSVRCRGSPNQLCSASTVRTLGSTNLTPRSTDVRSSTGLETPRSFDFKTGVSTIDNERGFSGSKFLDAEKGIQGSKSSEIQKTRPVSHPHLDIRKPSSVSKHSDVQIRIHSPDISCKISGHECILQHRHLQHINEVISNVSKSGRRTSTFTTKTLTIEPPRKYNLSVFVPINKNAARMYYRPWSGDRLPVADVVRPKPSPAFY